MEGRQVKVLLIVALVLGMLARQSTAGFPGCYAKCFGQCIITTFSPIKCALQCMTCIINPSGLQPNSHDYCKLGCAMNACTNISTRENPGNSLSFPCALYQCLFPYIS